MKIFKRIKKGFTLVELVVVIAVIAILSGVGVGTYIAVTNNAKQSVANQEATQLKTAIQVQSISTWSSEETSVDLTVTWDANNKAVLVGGLNMEGETITAEELLKVEKIFDDMIADSQGKEYAFETIPEADHYVFNSQTSTGEGKFGFIFTCAKPADGKGIFVKELTLVHSNGYQAKVLEDKVF